jgi:uncharacterized protein (DUF488 family)
MTIQLKTIGVYGLTEEAFFEALQTAEIDTFIDIRRRRGVRGAKYAFANSQRLQARLQELGIHYLHIKDLAPTQEVRELQNAADKADKTPKRRRTTLGDVFVDAYRTQILDPFDPQTLTAELPRDAQNLVLFCVEREPAACHRSHVAQKLHQTLGWPVEHLVPEITESQ